MTEAIVIGAGHNGLTTAIYLAKAGLKVTVFEAGPTVGGLARRDTICEGYQSLGVLNDAAQFRPWIIKELDLEKHGLKRDSIPTIACHSTGADPIYLDGDKLAGAVDDKDRAEYGAHRAFLGRIGKTIAGLLDRSPVDPLGPIMPLLGPLLNVRRLGAEDMTELMRIGSMCVADWMRDTFSNERVGAGIAQDALVGSWCGPWSPWTSLNLVLHQATRFDPIAGGSPAVIDALSAAAKKAGVQIETNARVHRILTENGRATGVETSGGDGISAAVVASSLDPKSTLLCLLGRRQLASDVTNDVRNIRTRGTTAKLDLALSGVPQDTSGAPIVRLRTGDNFDDIERAYDAVKYQQMSQVPMLDMTVATEGDGAQCPAGHAVASITAHYAPHDLVGGWTDEARNTLLGRIRSVLAEAAPNIGDLIVGERLLTPVDLDREFGLTGGHIFHGEHAPDQLLFMRPTIGTSDYTTPIEGLFLCGSGAHPGGGITGAPGALAAAGILKNI